MPLAPGGGTFDGANAALQRTPGGRAAGALGGAAGGCGDLGRRVEFLPPLSPDAARAYWQRVADSLSHGSCELLLAERDGTLVGAVQLELATQPNARHRAVVRQLLVHSRARRQGIARFLMGELEQLAKNRGRTLLVLDTREGDPAEKLYLRLGYQKAGRIPDFTRGASGLLEAGTVFYRQLEPA